LGGQRIALNMLENYKQIINEELINIFKSFKKDYIPKILYDAMHYSVFNGGKRIRPVLCIATYEAVNAVQNKSKFKIQNSKFRSVMPFACGIEFIHTFSLIQDDLPSMDNDDFRRGKPTLHKAFNEGVALLAADALFAFAFEVFARAPVDEKRKNRAIAELARICGPTGLVAGQLLDIKKKSQIRIGRTKDKGQKLIDEKKTAQLIAGAMKIGAIVAGAKDKIIDNIAKAGIYLGLLFQATDDLLDSKIKRQDLIERSRSYEKNAKRIFRKLGVNFADFIGFTDFILERKA